MKTINKEQASALALIKKQSVSLYRKTVDQWRSAWQAAKSAENPRRAALYRIYDDIVVDGHLSGAITQRKNMTLQKKFFFTNKNTGNAENGTGLDKMFEQVWFKDFMSLVLDSIFYGHSLIELGSVTETGFSYAKLVPRSHVMPEFGVILPYEYDAPSEGTSYREPPLADWCIEAGQSDDLGKLLDCCPHAISKRSAQGYWDEFAQLFGMPVRIAKTATRDKNEILQITDMLRNMGPAAWGLFPEGTELSLVENTKGDAFNVFDRRIDRANSEMSKCILGQTMTLDSGSSYSQSEVHLTVLKNIVERDADMVRDIVNGRLLPLMEKHGFKVSGITFNWANDTQYTPEQQLQMEQMLLNAGYDIDPKYFSDKYGVPVKGRTTLGWNAGGSTTLRMADEPPALQNVDSFFA